jgi:hypothetical protein
MRLNKLQLDIVESVKNFKYTVVCAGRRSGKTFCESLIAFDWLDNGRDVIILTKNYKHVYDIFFTQYLEKMTKNAMSQGYDFEINKSRMTITRNHKNTLYLKSAESVDDIRGMGLRGSGLIILDEFAFFPHQEYIWNEVCQPLLSQKNTDGKSKAIISSTPMFEGDKFHELFTLGNRPVQHKGNKEVHSTRWNSIHYNSFINDSLDKDELEAIKAEVPADVFAREYMAIFGDISSRLIKYSEENWSNQIPPYDNITIGIDCGRENDYTVMATLSESEGFNTTLIDIERFTGISFVEQADRIVEYTKKYPNPKIIVEKNNFGIALIDILRDKGLPIRAFDTTNQSKQKIIEKLMISVEGNHLLFYENINNKKDFIQEMNVFSQEKLPSGVIRYAASEGFHDDIIMALAIANYHHGRKASTFIIDL